MNKIFERIFARPIGRFVLALLTAATVASCGGSGAPSSEPRTTDAGIWTWMSGSSSLSQSGVYGTKGTAHPDNIPGTRQGSISWIDSSGNLWLMGGFGTSSTNTGFLNDLWKYDGTDWTWVAGSDARNPTGTYGVKGTANNNNIPGGRRNSVSWIDSSDNLWLFGGNGYDSAGNLRYLNDLWKFDGAEWTWVSGSDVIDSAGTYGVKGTSNINNIPGARTGFISWIDSSGNFWLFGGLGRDSAGTLESELNDLWKFDGAEWTWVSGSDVIDQRGNYGALDITASTNVPGARAWSISWVDSSNNLWLFGGRGYPTSGSSIGYLNDLWKFDGADWTWVSGSTSLDQSGTYGTEGVVGSANDPGARLSPVSWIDNSGNLWMFGGKGYDTNSTLGFLNDLWKFDGTDWTWVLGSNAVDQSGTYGTLGTADSANVPGARSRPVTWIDSTGDLWLFGGIDITNSYRNDLWRYQP